MGFQYLGSWRGVVLLSGLRLEVVAGAWWIPGFRAYKSMGFRCLRFCFPFLSFPLHACFVHSNLVDESMFSLHNSPVLSPALRLSITILKPSNIISPSLPTSTTILRHSYIASLVPLSAQHFLEPRRLLFHHPVLLVHSLSSDPLCSRPPRHSSFSCFVSPRQDMSDARMTSNIGSALMIPRNEHHRTQ